MEIRPLYGELVSVITDDKVRLEGFLATPSACYDNNGPVQAAVIVHGLSGNFYQSSLLRYFAEKLTARGIAALLVNTRGHDYLNATPQKGCTVTMGAALEVIDDCRFDLFAWCQFLTQSGFQRLLLMGHSLGAIKALYAQAHQPHPAVTRVAAYSATKLSYDSLLGSPAGDRFSHWLQRCQQYVAENRGEDLIFVDFPFPTWMSAAAYLNKYGAGDRYNWLAFKELVSIPTLAVFGQREMEDNPAFMAMQHDLTILNLPNFQIHILSDADHFYSASFAPAFKLLADWIVEPLD